MSISLPLPIAFNGKLFLTELMAGGECRLRYESLVHGHHVVVMLLLNSMCLLAVGSLLYGMLFAFRRCTK